MGTACVASEWQIERLDGAATLDNPSVNLSSDGTFAGSTGCNRFQGNAVFEPGALVIEGPVATTRMACPGDALTRQDDTIIGLFAGRVTITFDPLRDALTLANGEHTIDLARAMPGAAQVPETHAGGERPSGDPPYLFAFGIVGKLDIMARPATDANVLGSVDPGTVLRNAGCADADGTRWCEVALLDGSLAGWALGEVLEAAGTALRAGQGAFDAAGLIPCAKGIGTPMSHCGFGVARDAGGSATVVVTRPDGLTRALFFTDGRFVSVDTSEADGGHETSAAREGDLTLIRVNDERYEVPDAVVFGG